MSKYHNKKLFLYRFFHERCFYYNEKVNPLSAHIFAVGGTRWRFLRTNLTPTFTSGKMKLMFHTIVDCTAPLVKAIEEVAFVQTPIDIKEMLECFTTDVIGACAFGLKCNSFIDKHAAFRKQGREIFDVGLKEVLRATMVFSYPELSRTLYLDSFGGNSKNFMLNVIKNNYYYRLNDSFIRNDFFQLLIDIKKKCEENEKSFTIEDIAAQCFFFFTAGFETSAIATTFALYELAKNINIQNKARKEIREVLKKHDGKMIYETIQEMKYLRSIIDGKLSAKICKFFFDALYFFQRL